MVGFVYFVCINIINICICKLFLCVAEIGVNRSLPDPLSHYCVNCLYMKAIYGLNNVNSVLFCSVLMYIVLKATKYSMEIRSFEVISSLPHYCMCPWNAHCCYVVADCGSPQRASAHHEWHILDAGSALQRTEALPHSQRVDRQ